MILFYQERAVPQINFNQRGHDFQLTGTRQNTDLSALKIEWKSLQIGIALTQSHNHQPSIFYIIVYAIIKIIPSFSDYKTYLCNTPKQSAGVKVSSITFE